MRRVPPSALLAALLAFSLLPLSGAARAGDGAGFNQFVIFGDSTLDTGYFRYSSSGNKAFDDGLAIAIQFGATGGWAGNGVMNTTILGDKFGLSAAPIDNGGSNYANGGATTMNDNGASVPNNIDTIQQIKNYLANVNGVANPKALYLIKTGDNDATWVTSQGNTWIQQNPTYLDQVASNLAAEVAKLQAAGARTIVVRNSYDSALFAQRGGGIAPENSAAYARSYGLGLAEFADLAAAGVRFVPADNDSLFSFIAHRPRLFGFTEDTVLSTKAPFYTDPRKYTACMCILSPEEQRDYLFIDGIHLTTAGQTIEADYTYSLLTAPSEISLLAKSAVEGSWARAATIQGQIDGSRLHRGCRGVNVWSSAGAYSLEVHGAPGFAGDSGAPFAGAAGVDYQTSSGVIVGLAFGTGNQTQRFSTGGNFNQADQAVSLYLAAEEGPFWGDAVLSFDLLQNEVARRVPLGIFTDQNFGKTDGDAFALALRGGYDLSGTSLHTGPIVGMVLQQVHIDAFTETGSSGVTALAFGAQTQNSFVSQLGWRVGADLDAWQPFAEMYWDHEWAGDGRMVSASLTTMSAPSFALDAAPMATDWATLSVGTFYKLSPRVILRGAATALFINPQITTCGGELGLNVSF